LGISKITIFIVLSSRVNSPFHKLSTIVKKQRIHNTSIKQKISLIISIFLILDFDYIAISTTPTKRLFSLFSPPFEKRLSRPSGLDKKAAAAHLVT